MQSLNSQYPSFNAEAMAKSSQLTALGLKNIHENNSNELIGEYERHLASDKEINEMTKIVDKICNILSGNLIVVFKRQNESNIVFYKEQGKIKKIDEAIPSDDELSSQHKTLATVYATQSPHVIFIERMERFGKMDASKKNSDSLL
ncbi:MAG: hypothetical protein LLG04_11535, partial [Parachlamydia sp.]|nr:hypothetical protein [Parachlamydia sp.]